MKKRVLCAIILLSLVLTFALTSCSGILDYFGDFIREEQGNDLNNDQNNDENDNNNVDPDENDAEKDEYPGEIEDDDDLIDSTESLEERLAKINVPDRFKVVYNIDEQKLKDAAVKATDKLRAFGEATNLGFIGTSSTDYKYTASANNNWTCGMYTGSYLMAYLLTKDEWFSDAVNTHIESYIDREANKIGMNDHDVGFVFMPSCVGAYKILGSESARDAAIRAVEYYYGTSYSIEGGFIIRSYKSWDKGTGCRTMIDSMMNSTLFYWAGSELDHKLYSSAAITHTYTTIDLIIRDDYSTYHHYQFEPTTAKPLYGLTWQGYSDESCWSRGHSWGIYGLSIAYSYTKNSYIRENQAELTYYMLNHLPDDLIPYWDYTFMSGEEPRDSSAAAISICGMLDMASMLPESSAERLIYESAAAQMMEALIDKCTTDLDVEYDGLIHSVTHGVPQGLAIEECAPYADYFYLEALARYLCHDFVRPW